MSITLRSYQVEAVNAASRLLNQGHDPLVVHATGVGKTTSMAELTRREVKHGGNVLILAHRVELLDQIQRALAFAGVDSIRKIEDWGSCHVVVTSPASARRQLYNIPSEIFSLVIVDEAHHAVAGGHRTVIDHFREGARVLGFTATTDRLDGVGLHNVFDAVAHEFDIEQAIDAEYLVPARAIRVVVEGIDLSEVRRVCRRSAPTTIPLRDGGAWDLHPGDLGRAVIGDAAISGVVDPLLELTNTGVRGAGNAYSGLRTIVFAVNVQHMKALCNALRIRGASARWVDGTLGKKARAEVLRAHKAGEFQFLVNVLVLTEGYDDPGIGCVAMVRPTQSRILFAQACGRGLRPLPGKTECLILDFCGVSSKFSLVGPESALAGGMAGPVMFYRGAGLPTVTAEEIAVGLRSRHRWWHGIVNLLLGRRSRTR